MKNGELRAELRAEVTKRGELNAGVENFPCVVQDMSDSGLLIMCTRPLNIGQTLHFKSELFRDKFLECMIEVVHIGENGIGTKIVELDEQGRKLIQLFLQEHFTDQVKRWV
ncbi:MAG: hypothetical protein GTO41_00370 [Burkholderiales bacterium]|nr:hypothetical protein [Burkholderiales bacterium]